MPEGLIRCKKGAEIPQELMPEVGISVTDDWEAPHFAKECRMFPQNVALGVRFCAGADPGKDAARQAVLSVLSRKHISRQRVFAIFAGEEPGQKRPAAGLADALDVPCFTYTRAQLAQGAGVSGEEEALCEGCALLGSGRGRKIVSARDGEIAVSLYEMEMKISF